MINSKITKINHVITRMLIGESQKTALANF